MIEQSRKQREPSTKFFTIYKPFQVLHSLKRNDSPCTRISHKYIQRNIKDTLFIFK